MKLAPKYLILVLCILSFGCQSTKVIRKHIAVEDFNSDISNADVIKLYMKDGSLYILDQWAMGDNIDVLRGQGFLYDINRKLRSPSIETMQTFNDICKDDISIIETNQLQGHTANMVGITLPGIPLAAMSIYCIINPKSCFGSCPTFYTQTNQNWNLTAEGFSSSILPSFEKRDIDKLYLAEKKDNKINLKLTNEALETHAVRYAKLLAFPKQANKNIFYALDKNFYSVNNIISPEICSDLNGDCLNSVLKMDNLERFSLSHPKNLVKKEEVILTFNTKDHTPKGLIINSRQTLLTTFLFYQTMAYSGNYFAVIASEVENGNNRLKDCFLKSWGKLGGIEIYIRKKTGGWKYINQVEEMGPIASDFHLVRLPQHDDDKITIKLRMTQGLWRINYLALADICKPEVPIVIQPESIVAENLPQKNQYKLLRDTSSYLFTLPGDKYLLTYHLPEKCDYEFFLDTKGYYLEWMREEWKEEEDLGKLKLLFAFPGIYYRIMADDFKKAEPYMEESFWNSRYEITRSNRIMFDTP